MSADYDAIAAGLWHQRAGRELPADLIAAVRESPMLVARSDQRMTLDWLRQLAPTDRSGFHATLREIRARYDADQVMLDGLWEGFGDEEDRDIARRWHADGMPVEEIAFQFAFIYDAQVTPAMITPWLEDR